MRTDLVTSVEEADTAAVWPVYDAVFGDASSYDAWLDGVWHRHVARDGFRLARAWSGESLIGFAYGYTGERGQWWSDAAAAAIGPALAEEWIGGHFEVVSVGVLPTHRGQGLGRALMRTVTEDLPHDRWLLMTTADADDPARRLYARDGWTVVGPGIRPDRVVLGRCA